MPKYTTPQTLWQVQGCFGRCGRVQVRGANEDELHFITRYRCPACRGSSGKHCLWCGREFFKPPSISFKTWRARKFCDQFCGSRASAPQRSTTLKAKNQQLRQDTPSPQLPPDA